MSTIKSDLVGKDIRYKHWAGGEKTGIISDVFGNGNYEVTVGFSRVLVTPSEVISIEEPKTFSRGGLLTHPDGTEIVAMRSKEWATRLSDQTKFRATDYYETNNQDEIIEVLEKGLGHRYEFYDRHGNKFEAEEFGITSGREDDYPHYMILDLDNSQMPLKGLPKEVYLKGERYYGEAVFIDGYNGYKSSTSDGMLSAVIDKSAVKDGDIHYLTTIQGELIRSKRYRGKYIFFSNPDQEFGNGGRTNVRRHVNHSEDYEVRYAKDKLHRTGYKGERKFEQGGSTPELLIYNTGKVDRFSRPIYKSKSGRIYVDVEMDDNNPSIHNVSRDGEPDSEISNYRIVSKKEVDLSGAGSMLEKEMPFCVVVYDGASQNILEETTIRKPTKKMASDYVVSELEPNWMEKYGDKYLGFEITTIKS